MGVCGASRRVFGGLFVCPPCDGWPCICDSSYELSKDMGPLESQTGIELIEIPAMAISNMTSQSRQLMIEARESAPVMK